MVTSFFKFFIDPFNILWILVAAAIILHFLKKRSAFVYVALSSVVWFLIISTPLVPGLALNSLENRYEPIQVEQLGDPAEYDYIVILGGGHGFDDRLPANSLLSTDALGRLAEGIRLHRQLPNSYLVMSGYSASGRTTQAEMLKEAALLLGVEENRILMQKEPANTYQEAKVFSERFADNNRAILVTTASHMPRAVMMFHLFEVDVTPSPANYRLKQSEGAGYLGFPSTRNMNHLKTAIHEYAGMLRYRF
jgi:uncharacterized SAM-binding protein YcdF (DUF218 family)